MGMFDGWRQRRFEKKVAQEMASMKSWSLTRTGLANFATNPSESAVKHAAAERILSERGEPCGSRIKEVECETRCAQVSAFMAENYGPPDCERPFDDGC